MLLAGLPGICTATTEAPAPQPEESSAMQPATPAPVVRLERTVFHQEGGPFSMVVDLELETAEPGVMALPDRIVELEVKDDAGHNLKADWQIDNAGMELLWPALDASVWVNTPIIGNKVEVSGKMITLISAGSDIRRMNVTTGEPCTIALEGHRVSCNSKVEENGAIRVNLEILGEHIAYITALRFLTPEGESIPAAIDDVSLGFESVNAIAINDTYSYKLNKNVPNFTIEFTVQKPKRIEAVPFRFSIDTPAAQTNAPTQVDNQAKLLQDAEAARAEAAAIEQAPTELLAETAELWALYRECRLGNSDLTPLQERIAQIKQPKQLYGIAVFFESCMPDVMSIRNLPENSTESAITEALEQVERASALWSARSVVRGYCQKNLLDMAKAGNEEALVYLRFLTRNYPGATEPEGVDYYEESSKLLEHRAEPKQ